MEEVWFCLLLVVGLFGMFICLWFCLVKQVWEPWHYDVLPEEEEDKDDSQDNEESNVLMQSTGTFVRTTANSSICRLKGPSKHLTSGNLKDIGTKLINKFKNQRKLPGYFRRVIMKQSTQKQFAVLYLSFSKEDLLEPNFTNIKITDNSKKLFPLDDGLSNYVTARPHKDLPIFKGRHAEELIAGKFAKLVEVYRQGKKEIQCIVLYTWLFPCKDCAANIISKIQQAEVSTNVPIYILYSRVRGNEEKEKENIKNNLEFNGIQVKRVFSRNI